LIDPSADLNSALYSLEEKTGTKLNAMLIKGNNKYPAIYRVTSCRVVNASEPHLRTIQIKGKLN